MKKTISIVLALLAVFSSFISPAVFAAEPHTYIVRYVPGKGEWRSQQRSSWDNSEENYTIDYLWGNLSDGDSLIIIGDDNSPAFGELTIEKKLERLTLSGITRSVTVNSKKDICEIYVLKGTVATLNGSYDTIYVYDDCSCNINNRVMKLQVSGETCMKMNVTAQDEVHFCEIEYRGDIIAAMYNVAPGKLKIVDGENLTDTTSYGDQPYNSAPDPVVPAPVGEQPEYSFWERILIFFRRVWAFAVRVLHIFDFFRPLTPDIIQSVSSSAANAV